MQKKSIRFCLILDKAHLVSLTEFRSINWLPNKGRVGNVLIHSPLIVDINMDLQDSSTLFAKLSRAKNSCYSLVPFYVTI